LPNGTCGDTIRFPATEVSTIRRFVLPIGILMLASMTSGAVAAGGPARGGCLSWEIVDIPSSPSEGFQDFDGPSATDFWAVGDSSSAPDEPTILHYDGTEWTEPPMDLVDGNLYAVDVVSEDDAWAVGNDGFFTRTLAMHWDGFRWSEVPTPPAPQGYDFLAGVSAVGPTDVWAAGYVDYGTGLVIHWDGNEWSAVPHEPSQDGERFRDILALAADDVWAVGERLPDQGTPMIQHWDGVSWTDVRIPHAGEPGVLTAVDGSAPDQVYAVGWRWAGGALMYRWDGTRWRRVNKTPYANQGFLAALSVLAPDDLWVAGDQTGVGPPIAAHWNGRKWTFTSVPDENASFGTIEAFSHTEVWAGGHAGGQGIRAERYVGCP
jgi:hypothetical protein